MPIGELFDLEKLSEHCKKVNRWSFFVSSEVCNVPGGVARFFSLVAALEVADLSLVPRTFSLYSKIQPKIADWV